MDRLKKDLFVCDLFNTVRSPKKGTGTFYRTSTKHKKKILIIVSCMSPSMLLCSTYHRLYFNKYDMLGVGKGPTVC